MKFIRIDAVKVAANRQRKTFDPASLRELTERIQQQGLFHPPVLRIIGEDYYLVAGERRLRAITDIYALGGRFRYDGQLVPEGSIPYSLLSDLDELAAEEAELSENIDREDLTWQERAAAHARLAALRAKQAAVAGLPAPTVADISKEVRGSSAGSNQEATRRELLVAKHLDNPEVKSARTVDEAFKILKTAEAKTKQRELGASVGKTFTAAAHRLLNEDSLAWMEAAAPAQFDCILTDPPYGMDADSFGDSGIATQGAHGYDDSPEYFKQLLAVLAPQSFRLAKEQAHLYCFCDIGRFEELKSAFASAGWKVFRTPLIWYKRTGMRAPWPDQGPQRKYETILYAVKGKRPHLKLGGDVLEYAADTALGHMAQKPVALCKELLSRTCLPGETVADFFCGSGPIFTAAHELKVRATGIERDQGAYGIAVKRLAALREDAQDDLLKGL